MPRKFYGLKRPKLRQSWNKYNLFNFTQVQTPPAATKTFFQQKWAAKSMTRGYHHPQMKEKLWERMFDRRLPAVVPMDYRYLARHDGSEMAQGRGAGAEEDPDQMDRGRQRRQKTPYMHMAYHPLERRLDTAIWRAMFASSTKQARQFVVHGAVKVNGKKMQFPSYQLNPGDMFSVEPDMVMFATGQKKENKNNTLSSRDSQEAAEKHRAGLEGKAEQEEEESQAGAATLEGDEDGEALEAEPYDQEDPKKALQALAARAQRIVGDSKRNLSGKRLQELRSFTTTVRKTMSKLRSLEDVKKHDTIEDLEAGLAEILTKIPQDKLPGQERLELDSAEAAQQQDEAIESSNPQMQEEGKVDPIRARKDAELLHAAIERAKENPPDRRKPYATPWKPRDFMSAFAFIPRYLEVNQNICSAVYLRHPVARPGMAEVPTPFHGETLGLAFNWYLRRR